MDAAMAAPAGAGTKLPPAPADPAASVHGSPQAADNFLPPNNANRSIEELIAGSKVVQDMKKEMTSMQKD
eukprot:7968405-Karenia_brevis.AAC.1